MAKTERYIRNSGATTIKKDGKIVGNIGRGKDEVPIAQKFTGKHTLKQSVNTVSPFAQIAEKFTMVQKTNMVSERTQQPEITDENIYVLWEMAREQPIGERLDFLVNFMTQDNKDIIYSCCQYDINLRENYSVLYHLAQRTEDPRMLDILATTKTIGIWNGVFSNPHISLKTLEAISKSKDYEKKCYLVYIPQVSAEICAQLAKDRSVKVRRNLAQSEYTPPAVLTTLAKDKDMRVRQLLAENENTPPSTLAILAQSSPFKIRDAIARNLNTPTEVLEKLENEDADYEVRRNASRTLSYRFRQRIGKKRR